MSLFDDEFVKQNNKRILSGFSFQPRYKPEPKQEEVKQEQSNPQSQKSAKSQDVLLDIYNRFDVQSSKRSTDLGLSAEVANKIYKHIEKEQLVEKISLNVTGKKGGLSKYHVLTNKGYEAINKKPIKRSGGTGAKHFFLQRYFKKHLPEKGFSNVEVEKNLEGKRIDVYAIFGELRIGIEICITTIKTEHLNVQKDFDKCDCIFVVCSDKKTKQKLEKEIPESKAVICVVHEFLNAPEELIKRALDLKRQLRIV